MRSLLVGIALSALYACEAQPEAGPAHTNALAAETSPYLLQHAHNPVDWHPWGEAALAEAVRTDKLMLISVGYAACHWCHVMERESFEDSTVAAVMNEHFVSVKVDREERPDVDDVYMRACQITSGGSCGWPLNAVALPDGRPVWAGTYFPREKWLEVLEYFVALRAAEPAKLEAYAAEVAADLNDAGAQPPVVARRRYDRQIADDNAARIVQLSDPAYGGLAGAPKFPMPSTYEFLLTHEALTGRTTGSLVLAKALEAMARGGLYDQLGGGFARYATDEQWRVPHFEKMLYDNAQLVSLYARAYRATGEDAYRAVVTETLDFVARELSAPDGGFYSSLDADSEGEEGKYYAWTYDQLRDLLTAPQLAAVETAYAVTERGNWEDGKNILYRAPGGPQDERAAEVLAEAEARLLEARSKRVRPALDDKVLVSWNALMLKGYVDAYLATGTQAYLQRAKEGARYLEATFLQPDGSLLRTRARGKTHVNAFLDDYANLADAYLALYQADFDERWLLRARALCDYALEHFDKPGAALLYYTSDEDAALVARLVQEGDNVLPSSNSVMADNLLTLGAVYGEATYTERARAMVTAVLPQLAERAQPAYWPRWLTVYARLAYPSYEVAVVGERAPQLRLALAERLLPQAIFLGSRAESTLALLEGKYVEGENLIYVCEDRVCQFPTPEVDKAFDMLEVAER